MKPTHTIQYKIAEKKKTVTQNAPMFIAVPFTIAKMWKQAK